jgi:hypothetical protein
MRRYFEAEVGWRTPQLKIQITPFSWGVGVGKSKYHLGLRVGPIAINVSHHPFKDSLANRVQKYSYPE